MSWKQFYIYKSPPKMSGGGLKSNKSAPESSRRKSKPPSFDQMTIMSDDDIPVPIGCQTTLYGHHHGHGHGHGNGSLALSRSDYPNSYVTKHEWAQYREMMSGTLNQAKQDRDTVEGLKSTLDDMRDSQAKRHDDCLSEIQKVRDHLEEQEKKREEAQRLDNIRKEAYERGKKDEQERAAAWRQNTINYMPYDDFDIAEVRGFRMGCERERLRRLEAETQNKDEWERMEQLATLIGDHIIDRATLARREPRRRASARSAYRQQLVDERSRGLIDDHPCVRADELSDFLPARPPRRGGHRR